MTTDYGARLGGGVGDLFRHTLGKRWLLDILYFFAIVICVFNLVAGVVITTFGRLREEKNERMRDTEMVCFICGIDKQVFDRAANDPNGFKVHIRDDHFMWNYMCFIFFIWEQDKDDDDGMEYYVRHKIESNDIEWLPMNKAMRLEQAASVDEQLRGELKEKLEASKELINGRMKKMQTNVVTVLEQLTLALKKDHSAGAEEEEMGGLFFRASASRQNEDFSVVSLQASVSRIILPKRITLQVIEVCGLNVPAAVLETVVCRVVSEEGTFVCTTKLVEFAQMRVVFQSEPLLVCQDGLTTDTREVKLCVCTLDSQGVESEVGLIDLPVTELMEGDGLYSEKVFMRGEDTCSITILASMSNSD